ncbi:Cu(I)-responsive transcriptional regulator [Notoacmeibacter ruber]|uniref:Cu(I)-responsive transcriptional regulator n=1 Tax=Notoacmeibacter ruber TaxID=2670375 RepID=A0A3L7J9A0_9HYPH|nr:Cu(I)-responsive transcriptional regulator [Notoacmeibacter ruber]RLQ86945.1 Cu(I)-responsive transcriptional regulator [Notoacmeibacter ruber]
MNIGDVSAASGLPAKTIRYYEEIGLIDAGRGANGYRDFSESDGHKLAFLGRARSLGFSIEDCRTLLSLYEDRERASADVKAVATEHIRRITSKIEELESLRQTLSELISRCKGNDRPDCPIIDDLSGARSACHE